MPRRCLPSLFPQVLALLAVCACTRAPAPAPPTNPPAAHAPVATPGAAADFHTDADAAARVAASMRRFAAARSFHAEMTLDGATAVTQSLDFVAPDRYRIRMPAGTQVIIGRILYLQAQGQSLQVPVPEGTLTQWRDPMGIGRSGQKLDVQALGADSVDGQPAQRYRVRNGGGDPNAPVEFTCWIGRDGLPLQLRHQGQARGQAYTMTVRYSRFDDPAIAVEAPR